MITKGGTVLVLFCILEYSTCSDSNLKLKNEIKATLEKNLMSNIESLFLFILQQIENSSKTILKVPNESESREDLNSTTIIEALNNLKDFIPERTPTIPFAVVEPTSDNILFYFGTLKSTFLNLSLFTPDAMVNNTDNGSSISVYLHFKNTSLEGLYELDICNYDVHLYGDGNYSLTTEYIDLVVSTSIHIFENNSFQMADFSVNTDIYNAKLTMTNLLDGETSSTEPLLDLISTVFPAEITTINEFIQPTTNQTVVGLVNKYLAPLFSWNDIIFIIRTVSRQ